MAPAGGKLIWLVALIKAGIAYSFLVGTDLRIAPAAVTRREQRPLRASPPEKETYSDPLTRFLGKFLPQSTVDKPGQAAADLLVNQKTKKQTGLSSQRMANLVDSGLRQYGWFVTGKVDASIFSDDFEFSDPSVSLKGIAGYAEGVAKLFNQEQSKMDVIRTTVADNGDVVVEWRLEAVINLPLRPRIKPYVVTTTFTRDPQGLLCTQRDEFSIPSWEILLSTVFPGIGTPPAPPVV